ncbi:C4-dicarboxylate ABC transporter [Tistrella bauzanensis]|uniref:C4-dicarboxylate ABC transporter n=1 Tax=Tistrella bauzanensis TaxID=657419 RepID=A0ABQ1IZE7_9PROT|nr:TRAP transporter large permease subunit [Tistrella bauzanensis]GGB54834.1 C4-dicarboxylate ABC transporter [Tistrella bauzanensis]
MLALIAENIAPIMFITVMGLLLLGYPVAFTLAAGGLLFFAIGVELSHLAPDTISLSWSLLQALPDRVYGTLSNDTLLAIPFFTLMGAVLQKSGIAEDLLDVVGRLFGKVRGGLCYAVILVGTLLAATTGVVSASVLTMGLISLPIMLRNGYSPSVAAGAVTASGTLSQIIPPSLVLIVMADQLGQPVSDIYLGAIVPGALMVGLYLAYIAALAVLFPRLMPAIAGNQTRPADYLALIGVFAAATLLAIALYHVGFAGLRDEPRLVAAATAGGVFVLAIALADVATGQHLLTPLARQAVFALVPPLGLIFLVLGTIFLGIATPTESGSMGAVGALAIALIKRRLTVPVLLDAVETTARLAAFVMFILIGARVFSLTFYGLDGDAWLHDILSSLPGGRIGFIIFCMVVIFVLGCFLDFFEIAFIVIPLLIPTAMAFDIDLVWFAILISINLQTSFLTPPFGFALFYLRSVAPRRRLGADDTRTGIATSEIYLGALAFIAINAIVLALVMAFPGLVLQSTTEFLVDPASVQIEVAPPTAAKIPGGNLNDLFK